VKDNIVSEIDLNVTFNVFTSIPQRKADTQKKLNNRWILQKNICICTFNMTLAKFKQQLVKVLTFLKYFCPKMRAYISFYILVISNLLS